MTTTDSNVPQVSPEVLAVHQKAIRQQLRLDGLTADLDALTGGWFSKTLPKAK